VVLRKVILRPHRGTGFVGTGRCSLQLAEVGATRGETFHFSTVQSIRDELAKFVLARKATGLYRKPMYIRVLLVMHSWIHDDAL